MHDCMSLMLSTCMHVSAINNIATSHVCMHEKNMRMVQNTYIYVYTCMDAYRCKFYTLRSDRPLHAWASGDHALAMTAACMAVGSRYSHVIVSHSVII